MGCPKAEVDLKAVVDPKAVMDLRAVVDAKAVGCPKAEVDPKAVVLINQNDNFFPCKKTPKHQTIKQLTTQFLEDPLLTNKA